jgi:HK97 family phage portal protein
MHNIGLNTGFVYKCVDMRSNSVATAMLGQKLYYYANAKEKEEVEEHPYFDLLRYVNDQYTPYDLWYLTNSSFDFIGRCPWWVETDGVLNVPVRINPILPDMGRFTVLRNEYGVVTGYELHTGMKKITFSPFEIFYHTAVNINDSTYGLGLVNALVREANIDKLQKQKVLKLLQNGGIGKAHVQFDGNPQGDVFNKAVSGFERANNGADKEGQFIYTTSGTKVTALVDNSALERAVSILGLTRDQIIQLSGVMRVSLGIGGSTTKADAETQYLVYLRDHITPLLTNLTSRLSQDFLQKYYPQNRGWLCAEVDSILPDDEIEKQSIREIKLRTAQAKPNDFLVEDGFEASADPAMDKYYLSSGLTPIGDASLDFTDIMNSEPKAKPKNNTQDEDNEETKPTEKPKKEIIDSVNSVENKIIEIQKEVVIQKEIQDINITVNMPDNKKKVKVNRDSNGRITTAEIQ